MIALAFAVLFGLIALAVTIIVLMCIAVGADANRGNWDY